MEEWYLFHCSVVTFRISVNGVVGSKLQSLLNLQKTCLSQGHFFYLPVYCKKNTLRFTINTVVILLFILMAVKHLVIVRFTMLSVTSFEIFRPTFDLCIDVFSGQNWKGYVVKHNNVNKDVSMTILDNYMFRPLLSIFRLSSRELKVLLYTFERARGAEISTYGPYCVMQFLYVVVCYD